MAYSFGAASSKKIIGSDFNLPASSLGVRWTGYVPEQEEFWPRGGAEAVCVQVIAREQGAGRDVRSVMKVFRSDLPQRKERQRFLVKQKLAKDFHWLFQCVPFSSLDTHINDIHVIGHLSQYVGQEDGGRGEDFDRLKQRQGFDDVPRDQRRNFVADLATATIILESRGIVHGDLSDGNVLIANSPEAKKPVLVLCDFDGFNHPDAPRLPRAKRPLGTDGYVPRFLFERIVKDVQKSDEDIYISSDRFALAILACELMCWSSQMRDELGGRHRLFDAQILREEGPALAHVFDLVSREWPDGANLLKCAQAARRWEDLPAPQEWLSRVGRSPSVAGLAFLNQPTLHYRRAVQDVTHIWKKARLTQSAGSLHPLGTGLAGVQYRRDEGRLTISLSAGDVAMVGHAEQAMTKVVGPADITVNPDSRFIIGGLEIRIRDDIMTA